MGTPPPEVWLLQVVIRTQNCRGGVGERICVMEKAVHAHTTSNKLFTLRVDMGVGLGEDKDETSLKNVSLAGHPVLPWLHPRLHPQVP